MPYYISFFRLMVANQALTISVDLVSYDFPVTTLVARFSNFYSLSRFEELQFSQTRL